MSTWTVRAIAAAASPVLGLAVAVVTPTAPQVIPSAAAQHLNAAQLEKTNVHAAVGHITADAVGHTCTPVDALEADTALVRYVGTVDVVRATASKAWAEAEQSDVVVYAWCAPTGGGAA
ncbi:hypothetical protein [Janibacter melonis]|uniref:hypothetical protein n=1 Tax=Janibacter melonis TaxID=262209 RepID=UPI0017493071|nr:hypothetical protein [Janibacter melonis]